MLTALHPMDLFIALGLILLKLTFGHLGSFSYFFKPHFRSYLFSEAPRSSLLTLAVLL